jgi:hypothetical protein
MAKITNGPIVNVLAPTKEGRTNVVMLTVEVPGTQLSIEMAKLMAGEDAAPADLINLIQEAAQPSFHTPWISRALLSHLVHGKKDGIITMETLQGYHLYCKYHKEGDMIGDPAKGELTPVKFTDTLVNNETIVLLKK